LPYISRYCHSTTFRPSLLCGLIIALLGSLFIYLAAVGLSLPLVNTLTGILSLYLLLGSSTKVWFWSGFFFGLFWFWWVGLSFIHYHMPWAIPIVILFITTVYGGIFWLIAKIAFSVQRSAFRSKKKDLNSLFTLSIKALGLLILSYVHPFTFDWFKPELMFIESYLGIEKWQFALVLAGLALTIQRHKAYFLLLLLPAYQLHTSTHTLPDTDHIEIITTHTPVEEKWDKRKHPAQFRVLLQKIDDAIDSNKTLVILPESVFPVFLKRDKSLFHVLKTRAKKINIVTGALYWDGKTPRNSTYIFTRDGRVKVANKVILVPFGEANPLPDFLSDWVNRVFYDNAVDYKASADVVDYTIEGKKYRNAICFEATSERLYEGKPERMIVLSNNGWFTPSIEPILQRLLLQYYARKYGTTIYHAVNMAPSYIIAPR
jgi:apolipoprotein N-acyltransferase